MSLLEQARTKHESIEFVDKSLGDVLDEQPKSQKARVLQQHRISSLVKQLADLNNELKLIYEDQDGIFSEEVAAMRGSDMFEAFYRSIESSKGFYDKYPNHIASPFPQLLPCPDVQFSGEEVFGKYLDLHQNYFEFCNLPMVSKSDQDYVQYLDKFNNFFYISENTKMNKQYSLYLNSLWSYLKDFFAKIHPLVQFEELVSDWKNEFADKWARGKVSGWKPRSTSLAPPQTLRLAMFSSPSELEALGMERLKEALEALGLKCGGTLADRAGRLWAVRDVKFEDIPEKLKAKPTKRKFSQIEQSPELSDNSSDSRQKQIAWLEYRISSLCDIMMDTIVATRKHVERQQSRTLEEKEAELLEEEFGHEETRLNADDDDDDDGDEPIYNPLNLPLGWDGKPIPYWLYKLHGLGVEFKCEICGNQSYWGRRNFDKHFQEWRHAYGMRCLGVPNTKHFHDITLIEDVLTLYSKIKDSLSMEQFIAEVHEEFEDSEGNVLSRQSFENLARQGLL